MLDVNEIFVLFLSTGVLILTLILMRQLVLVPCWKILLAAFILYYLSNVLTVVEDLFWPSLMNFLEHSFRALFPAVIILWCLKMSRSCPSDGGKP